MNHLKFLNEFLSRPLLISPSYAEQMRVAVSGINPDSKKLTTELFSLFFDEYEDDNDNNDNGVSVISISGALTHRRRWSSNYVEIQDRIAEALEDSNITKIVLDIDTPGGEAAGVFDLSDFIYNSRGTKPIIAIASESALSAGYLIASAADSVIVSRTSRVGSVGVVRVHEDISENLKERGVKVSLIHAGAHKTDGNPYEPLTKDTRDRLQAGVDETYSTFVETVARNRGMSTEDVRKTEALTYSGQEAVNVGFADKVMSYNESMNHIINLEEVRKMSKKTTAKAATETENLEAEKEKVKAEATDKDENLEAGGESETVKTETVVAIDYKKIASLCQEAGSPELAAQFLQEELSVEDVESRLSDFGEIKSMCTAASGAIGEIIDPQKFIGLSANDVQKKLFKRMTTNAEEIDNSQSQQVDTKSEDEQKTQTISEGWSGAFKSAGANLKAS